MKAENDFVCANTFPRKIARLGKQDFAGGIRPRHICIIPTHKCNARCPWCSCASVDRSQELGLKELCEISRRFKDLGCRAVTISGGGDPAMHPSIGPYLGYLQAINLKVGFVTNGKAWSRPEDIPVSADTMTWIRLGVSDIAEFIAEAERFNLISKTLSHVDVGGSLVVTDKTDPAHVGAFFSRLDWDRCKVFRLLDDVTDPSPTAMDVLELIFSGKYPKAFFQRRTKADTGAERCNYSLFKPMIAADGYCYPCCGTSYARVPADRCWHPDFRMCHWTEFRIGMPPFNGGLCQRCYYKQINDAIDMMTGPVEHEDFP